MKYRLKDNNLYLDNVYKQECQHKIDYTNAGKISELRPEIYSSDRKYIKIAETLYKRVDL